MHHVAMLIISMEAPFYSEKTVVVYLQLTIIVSHTLCTKSHVFHTFALITRSTHGANSALIARANECVSMHELLFIAGTDSTKVLSKL